MHLLGDVGKPEVRLSQVGRVGSRHIVVDEANMTRAETCSSEVTEEEADVGI